MKRLIFIFTILFLYGCDVDKYLDKAESGGMTLDEIFGSYALAERYLSNIYSRLPVDYTNKYTNASDDSESPHGTAGENQINNGVFSPASNPFNNWTASYQAIRAVNIFLQHADAIPVVNENQNKGKPRMIGEAIFLRAYFYAELFRRWGGVPILTEPLDINENMQIPRNTVTEVVKFIVDECDKAADLLDIEHPAIHLGRATKGAALALKSRVLLHFASPLHNPSNDTQVWLQAADAAKEVIDLDYYQLHANYKNLFHTRISKEIIFQRTSNYTDFTLQTFVPSHGGQVGITPLQNLVDMYEMTNGELPFLDESPGLSPTVNPASGYNPANPYINRDPRFYMSILYNGSTWRQESVYTYVGAPQDGIGGGFNNTTTGYYLAKLVDQNASRIPTVQNGTYYWIYFRYAEVLLNYAEALNEALSSPNTEIYNAVNSVRGRPGVEMPPLPAGLSKADMRKRIRNERRIELAFEGHRFFDVKRWRIGAQVIPNAYGMRAVSNGDGTYTYTRFLVENRVYPSHFDLFPIMQTELNRNTALEQNPNY